MEKAEQLEQLVSNIATEEYQRHLDKVKQVLDAVCHFELRNNVREVSYYLYEIQKLLDKD